MEGSCRYIILPVYTITVAYFTPSHALPCLFHLLMVVGNGGEQRVRMVNLMGFRLLIKMERESRVVFSQEGDLLQGYGQEYGVKMRLRDNSGRGLFIL